MKYSIAACTICLFLTSCHFYDDRISVKNDGESIVLAGICQVLPVDRDDSLSPFFPIEPGQIKDILLLRNLNYNFLGVDSVSVVIITPEAEESVTQRNGYISYERLFVEGRYEYYNLATATIEENSKILVIYPWDFN